jgi:FecR protein
MHRRADADIEHGSDALVKRAAEADDPRRRLLIKALAAGLFSGSVAGVGSAAAQVSGGRPSKLPPGQSVFRASGTTTVNDKPVAQDTQIRPGDTVRTGKNSEIVFVVSDCSMLLRAESQLVLEGQPTARLAGFKLMVGKLLSVYPPGAVRIETTTATVQIRGTGVYVESDPELTYFCTCFGVTDIAAKDDPDSRTTVQARYHDRPLYIAGGARNRGNSIRPARFINHTDEELKLIETLVGRTLPSSFVFGDPRYQTPKGGIYRQ